MAIELRQQLKLTQQLVMTPQLQQAIKLLQLNRLELVGLVQQELQENPVLEEVLEGDETDSQGGEGGGDEATAETDAAASAAADAGPAEGLEAGAEREPTDAEKVADLEWQDYMNSNPQTGIREAVSPDDRPSFESTMSRRPTLADHLEWQLQMSTLPLDEQVAANVIIGNLDDRGYLRSTIDEIARQAGVALEVVERTLAKIHGLDPAGVAARDLKECLTIQLRALEIDDPIVSCIMEESLDRLIKRDFRGVAKQLGITIEEVAAAATVIGRLEPRPGRGFGGDEPVYITPDIYVYKIGDEFHVVLNDDGLPRLRINGLYKDVLAKKGQGAVSKDTKDYVHDKVRSALWLIKSIHQRQRTIYKVMESIIKHQRGFFERGINYLKPLNLRDVADDIEMHESTVSRVTTNKYVHTPQGIFELKYFFNSSINRVEGEAVASESVKARIRRLIVNEDPRRPLSDQRIAEMLKVANIDIARRTVTKYRESMNLLSSTKRRQVG
ncbi:MAG: RNA polymerase factor sigma-54 [Deltaproteobacteria bacterium]|nr:RNA polymerase factor sigma-54 [Deltaproteobacteria bacterium]MBW2398503.1 RNA polymerase factor sigma-54 [Deltaproteobacteria bacterium]